MTPQADGRRYKWTFKQKKLGSVMVLMACPRGASRTALQSMLNMLEHDGLDHVNEPRLDGNWLILITNIPVKSACRKDSIIKAKAQLVGIVDPKSRTKRQPGVQPVRVTTRKPRSERRPRRSYYGGYTDDRTVPLPDLDIA